MRLTRRQLANDLATITAQRDQAITHARTLADLLTQRDDTIVDLTRQIERAGDHPSLATNIKLAHQLEQAETLLAVEQEMHAVTTARLQRFTTRYPTVFADQDTEQ